MWFAPLLAILLGVCAWVFVCAPRWAAPEVRWFGRGAQLTAGLIAAAGMWLVGR